MTTEGWIALGALSSWAALILTAVIYLHTRRTSVIEDIKKKIDANREINDKEHRDQRVLITDLRETISDHYVRKGDLEFNLRPLSEQIALLRTSVERISDRMDKVLDRSQFQRAGDRH